MRFELAFILIPMLAFSSAARGALDASDVQAAPPQHQAAAKFLIDNMPEPDRSALTRDFLFENVALAYQANLTRVFTFMMAREATDRTYPQIGVPDSFHAISHHQNLQKKFSAPESRSIRSLEPFPAERLFGDPDQESGTSHQTLPD